MGSQPEGVIAMTMTRPPLRRYGIVLSILTVIAVGLLAVPAAVGLPPLIAAAAMTLTIWSGIESLFSP